MRTLSGYGKRSERRHKNEDLNLYSVWNFDCNIYLPRYINDLRNMVKVEGDVNERSKKKRSGRL